MDWTLINFMLIAGTVGTVYVLYIYLRSLKQLETLLQDDPKSPEKDPPKE